MPSVLHDNFCNNVRAARLAREMTQLQLSEILGVSRPYVAEIEGGRHVPSLDVVERFAKALGVKGEILLLPPKKFSAAS